MPKAVEVPIPIKIDRLTEFLRIRGVPVYVHWSVLLIAVLILVNVIDHPVSSLVGLSAYFGLLFIHEAGHLIAAQRLGCRVISIKLYPIFGLTKFEMPWSKFDHCVIAWGGVISQSIIAAPIILWVTYFGYSRFEPINIVFALLGFFSLAMIVVNLLPIFPLDGSIAWAIIPEVYKRMQNRLPNRPPQWKR